MVSDPNTAPPLRSDRTETRMNKRTIDPLEATLDAVRQDLSPRVEELAQKSAGGLLPPEERQEYAEIGRINDTLSLLKHQAAPDDR